MAFKDRLKEARLKKNMTQEQLANSVGIAKSTLTGYEKGNREPNMLTVSNIMETLNVDANYLWQDEMGENFPEKLNYDELEHMGKYRSLNNDGRKSVDYHIDSLLKYESELKKMQIKESPTEIYQISVPTTTRSYAAGAGSIVYDGDDQVTDLNYPSDRVPKETDFASRVGGDSMEPTFFDGDIVFVEHAEILKIGEIGLFNINGENYIKECGKDGLVSHNKKHPIIKPTSQDTIVCIGRVLGKL